MSADDDLMKLAKFYLSENLYQFTIFYTQNYDILYNFVSRMSVASEDLKIGASQVIQSDKLQYEQVYLVQHPGGDYIAVYEGNRIRVVCLLKEFAINPVTQQYITPILAEFAEGFEGKYRKELKKYEEYTGTFTDIDEIISNTFLLNLSLPHIARYKGFDPEDQLEKYIFEAADQFCKTVGYLYLRNLLLLTKTHVIEEARNILLSDPRRAKAEGIDPDHIEFPPDEEFFIAMFKLRKLGMLEPIEIEELGSYSKIKY